MNKYELVSGYKPAGDQPKAIKELVEGVKQGRKTYDNIKKFVKYILSVNFDTILLINFCFNGPILRCFKS